MRFVLFFTEGTSLRIWEERGFLSRGIKAYNRLADFFDEFYFITYGGESELDYQGLLNKNIIILPRKVNIPSRIYSFLTPFLYWRQLKGADIFYCGQMQGAWSAVIAKLIFRKKFVLNCGYQWSLAARGWKWGIIKQALVYAIEFITYKMADFIIVTSDQARQHIIKRYKIPIQKIAVILNYIDTDLFKPINTQKSPKTVIFVGRLEKEKNVASLLEAVKGIDVNLVLIGNGGLKIELEKYAKMNKLNVKFLGVVANDELPAKLNTCEVFILPSLFEGNPKALLEAMACGLPVIGADVEGINEIIKHKENGYLCGTSPDSIREAIKTVIGSEELKIKMGENARKYVLENCNLDAKIKKETEIYRKLAGTL